MRQNINFYETSTYLLPTVSIEPLSKSLEQEIDRFNEIFWVSGERLKNISKRFEEELQRGLEGKGDIPMNVTWVQGLPTGEERGSFLTLDLGGTNIRVCWIVLTEKRGQTKVTQHQYKLPEDLKTGDAEKLWNFVADSLQTFIEDQNLDGNEENPLPLGFTFSYPATQQRIDHGALQTWTKGFDIKGVEGEDVAEQLRGIMKTRKLPIKLAALVNDTTGALIASAYKDPQTKIGAIFGAGCNAAYMEDCGSIPKISGLLSDRLMAINCEYGAFDNEYRVLPRTTFDKSIDRESPRPGEQTFEKMSAGLYLGELYRLILLELHGKGLILKDQDVSKIQEPYIIDTSILSAIEDDESSDFSDTKSRLKNDFGITLTDSELRVSRVIAEMIAVRGARLCACGIAAICRKKNIFSGRVAADGSVANKHPKFKKRWAHALGEILDWPEDRKVDQISMIPVEDGSGIGAAVIIALAMERSWH